MYLCCCLAHTRTALSSVRSRAAGGAVQATPSKIERQEDGKLKVTWTSGGEEASDVFDTVLCAIGEQRRLVPSRGHGNALTAACGRQAASPTLRV